ASPRTWGPRFPLMREPRPGEAQGTPRGHEQHPAAGPEPGQDIVLAPSWRRSVLSLLCCLVLIAGCAWLVTSPQRVRQRGGWIQLRLEKLGLGQPNAGRGAAVLRSDSEVVQVVVGASVIIPLGLFALWRGHELWRRTRWRIGPDCIQCLVGRARVVAELRF